MAKKNFSITELNPIFIGCTLAVFAVINYFNSFLPLLFQFGVSLASVMLWVQFFNLEKVRIEKRYEFWNKLMGMTE
jgi:hypothetical protein